MRTFLKILFFFLLITQICFAQGSWIKIGNMPEIRLAHTANEINGKIYIVGGGTTEAGADPTTAFVYDRLSGIWTIIPLINNEFREYHTSCVVDGKLYIIGGWTISGSTYITSAKIEVFDPNTGIWTSKNPMPTDRANLGCAAIDGKIYVIGGNRVSGGVYNGLKTLEAYDISAGTWTKLADMPTGRWGISVQAFKGKIYVFGGRSILDNAVFASVEVYDPQTNTWTTKSKMPTARYQATTCLSDSNIYIIGGWNDSAFGPIYDKVEIYNPESDKWLTESPLPVKRALLASIVLDGKIYVYGGSRTNHPLIGTSEIYELSFDDIFAQQPCVDKLYARENIDSVTFRTRFLNIYNHQFTPHLIIANTDSTQIDSLVLYDDGLHGDSLSNDGLYGGYILPRHTEDFFSLSTSTIDKQNNKYYNTPDRCRFTTAGPLVIDSIWSYNLPQYKSCSVQLFLSNQGNISLNNVSLKIICNDSCVRSVVDANENFPVIQPGAIVQANQYSIIYYDSTYPEYFNLKFDISSDGWVYWKDSVVKFIPVTGIKDLELKPAEYLLSQNYPNPFNPITTIGYGIKEKGNVKITIYNVIGEETAIVLNEEMQPGYHQVEFKAANLPSGVYFYRIQAGSFVETKKMILLK